jgi:hypothetical protein
LITFIAASHIDTLGGLDYLYKILISGGSSVQSPSDDDPLSLNDIQTILESSLRAYGLIYASLYGENREIKMMHGTSDRRKFYYYY